MRSNDCAIKLRGANNHSNWFLVKLQISFSMTATETTKTIKDIPLGSNLQIIKKSGEIIEVRLASHDVSGTEKKDYGDLVVPALPPALIVQGGVRFGNYRLEVEDIIKISWIE